MPVPPAIERIALFGGTFDPVHNAHIRLAEWVFRELQLDRIIFIPNYQHPFNKRKNITKPALRQEMLKRALTGFAHFEIDPFEIEREQTSYTVDTLRYIHQKFPAAELFFLMGADNVAEFDRWKEPGKILSLCRVSVYSRQLQPTKTDKRFHYLNNPLFPISSTDIRLRISNGQKCDQLLPPEVLDFIKQNRLYR